MKRVDGGSLMRRRWVVTATVGVLALGSCGAIGSAQSGTDAASQPRRAQGAGPPAQDQTLTKQLEKLRTQVALLQAAVERQRQPSTSDATAAAPNTAPGRSLMIRAIIRTLSRYFGGCSASKPYAK